METRERADGFLRLDPASRLPLHAQAEQLVRRLIKRPEYKRGGLLPDEVSLANSLGISRNTLRAAIGRLVAEGQLERKAGVGTRVAERRVQSGVGAWQSFTREMQAKGIKVETYSTEAKAVPVPEMAARALRLPLKREVVYLERVRGWEGEPEVVFQSYFHPRLGLTPEDDFQKPLYELIQRRCGMVADQSLEELSALPADRRLARLLHVKIRTPLLRRERTVLDRGRRPMEFALVHYRCDRFRLALRLRRE
ncbi:MAG: GntR family transcriptional regulator [Limisphaerales bacterium]